MVTSYYIIKMSKNRLSNKSDINERYYHKSIVFNEKKIPNFNKCRVCLDKGSVLIYRNGKTDIAEALRSIGDIDISENDNYPQHLCDVCYKFLKRAILFRKTAKQSEEVSRRSVEEESKYGQSQDTCDYSDGDTFEPKQLQIWESEEINNVKVERKIKVPPKVTCHVCNKVINRSYYKEHLTMHDPDHQKYVCDVCGKSFRLRCAYHNHSLRHRNDFPFKCQFCPYRGRYAELLKTHMRTHTGDYRYMCTKCPARFLFKSNLNSHMLKHKEPQFKCDACIRAFHTKLALQRHFEADHLGIKNHVCDLCGKAFGYRNAMMKHQRYVHKREKLLFGRMPSYLEAEQEKQGNL